jgi:hypothetical protein
MQTFNNYALCLKLLSRHNNNRNYFYFFSHKLLVITGNKLTWRQNIVY